MESSFTITAHHLKLLRRMNVGWQHCEAGAPEIDPKRPYGNGAHLHDIHQILTGQSIGCVGDARDELTEAEIAIYEKLHAETETALQISLVMGEFSAGTFQLSDEYDYRSWQRI